MRNTIFSGDWKPRSPFTKQISHIQTLNWACAQHLFILHCIKAFFTPIFNPKEYAMTTATKRLSQSSPAGFSAKLAQVAYLVAATVLMLEMREALHAKTSSDKSDAAFTYGL
jgi:hypothetical protein